MKGIRGAVTFLTRIPAGSKVMDQGELARSVRWFPLVGALIGLVVGATYFLLAQFLPPSVGGLAAVLVGVMLTGGLHEDGLGDAADAIVGGRDAADAARILKDPTHGTFGVVAIAGGLFLRGSALGSMSPLDGMAMAVAAHLLGRMAIVFAMQVHESIGDGLGARYSRAVTNSDVVVAIGVGIAVGAAFSGIWVLASLAIGLAAVRIVGRLAVNKVGGLTGDILGAIEQVAETGVLVLGAAIAHESWMRPAWWA